MIISLDLKVIVVRDLEMKAGIFSRFMGMTTLCAWGTVVASIEGGMIF